MSAAQTVDISLDLVRVFDLAGFRRWPSDDLGYLVHTVLTEGWRAWAPKPFTFALHDVAAIHRGGTRVVARGRVVGFAPKVQPHASFEVARVLEGYAVTPVNEMDAHLDMRAGSVLSLASVVCPTVRLASACGDYAQGDEVDAWDADLARGRLAEGATRESVYGSWFVDRLGDAFAVRDVKVLEDWQRCKRVRRTAGGKRRPLLVSSPQATIWALAEVRDVDAAQALIARGIGRHRSFGFGWVGVRDGVARPEPWDPRPLCRRAGERATSAGDRVGSGSATTPADAR